MRAPVNQLKTNTSQRKSTGYYRKGAEPSAEKRKLTKHALPR